LEMNSDHLVWTNPESAPVSLKSVHFGVPDRPVRLRFDAGRLVVDIPSGAAEAELAQGGDLKLMGEISGRKGPTQNLWAWMTSPDGPQLGQGKEPFSAIFSGIPWVAIRDGLGLKVDERQGSLGGSLALSGKWSLLGRQRGAKARQGEEPSADLRLDQLSLQGPGVGGLSGLVLKDHLAARLQPGPGSRGLWLHLEPTTFEFFQKPTAANSTGTISQTPQRPQPSTSNVTSGTLTTRASFELASAPGSPVRAKGSEEQSFELTLHDLGFSALGFIFPHLSPLTGTVNRLELTAKGGLPETQASLAADVGVSSLGTLNLAGIHGAVELAPDERGQLRDRETKTSWRST
jgi:hypothetical protein